MPVSPDILWKVFLSMSVFSLKASLPDIPNNMLDPVLSALIQLLLRNAYPVAAYTWAGSSQVTPGTRPERRYRPGTAELTFSVCIEILSTQAEDSTDMAMATDTWTDAAQQQLGLPWHEDLLSPLYCICMDSVRLAFFGFVWVCFVCFLFFWGGDLTVAFQYPKRSYKNNTVTFCNGLIVQPN